MPPLDNPPPQASDETRRRRRRSGRAKGARKRSRRTRRSILILIAIAVIVALGFYLHHQQQKQAQSLSLVSKVDPEPLSLFSSLPLYFGESDSIVGALNQKDEGQHWLRGWLEARFKLTPVDALVLSGTQVVNAEKYLLIAQPRALTGDENVALDNWVRDGGQVAIFADPMLTWESRFSIGDKRRPMDVALISPILDHWGLALEYDEDQPEGARTIALGNGEDLFVNQTGTLRVAAGRESSCTIRGGVVALCKIGQGQALIVADAAVLEPASDSDERAIRQQAVTELLGEVFTLAPRDTGKHG